MYVKFSCKAQTLMRATDVHLFLPCHDGYPDAKPPYPTLYFLPGYSANAEELATCLPLRQMCTLYGVAIVIPDGENAFYTDHPERATCNGSFVSDELVRITRALFPLLSTRREDTFIGGISMGGYGAAVHGLRCHDTFSRIVMMSPAIEPDALFQKTVEGAVPPQLFDSLMGGEKAYRGSWMDARAAVLALKAAGKPIPRLHMCCGSHDELVYDACARFRDLLRVQGVALSYEEGDGGHDVPYWDAHLENCFRFLTARE